MKYKLILFCLLVPAALSAQDQFLMRKLADVYYNNFYFSKAIPLYEQLLSKNPEDTQVCLKLATIYDHVNDNNNAERCYRELIARDSTRAEYILKYAQALSRNGKYNLSARFYEKLGKENPDSVRWKGFVKAYSNLRLFYLDSARIRIAGTPFSTSADDFSPARYGNRIVFASDRAGASNLTTFYNWTQSPYLDLFVADPASDVASVFSGDLNSLYHDGPVTFSRNQDTIIFTRSNSTGMKLHRSSEGVNTLGLFQAVLDKENNLWKNISPLKINNINFSAEHPALSPDGNELVFASDRPGGFGGMDLYVSRRCLDSIGNTAWGTPVNLGPGINSPGYEVFPVVDSEGNLWYASNGIPGLGGLDIFFASRQNSLFDAPVNPGYPLNTRYDDFGYLPGNAGGKGYLSSNRKRGLRDDDIYSVTSDMRHLVVMALDTRTKKVIPGASIRIRQVGDATKSSGQLFTGRAMVELHPFKSYQFTGSSSKYNTKVLTPDPEEFRRSDTLLIPLDRKGPFLSVLGSVFSALDNKPVPALVKLLNVSSGYTGEARSDANGRFSFDLEAETDYLVSAGELSGGSSCGAAGYTLSTRGILRDSTISVSVPVFCAGQTVPLEGICFDLDKSAIRPDAGIILDKLVRLMTEYPAMTVELQSHTDCRATAQYNMRLSGQRAESAAAYLNSKGIAEGRVSWKGYGETMPLNRCADGVECSEEEHALNRRIEVRIISM